jgi:hypothetical protein
MEPESFDRQTCTYLSCLISVVLIGCIVHVLRQSMALFVFCVTCKRYFLLVFLFGGIAYRGGVVWFWWTGFSYGHAIALLHCAMHCFLSLFIGITLFWVAHQRIKHLC